MARLQSEKAAASTIGLEMATFREWVRTGRLPPPVRGTDLYDLRAIEAALDLMSGIGTPQNALDSFLETRNAG